MDSRVRKEMTTASTTTMTSSAPQPSHLCAGCGQLIKDRYLLQALDCYWHEDCLKCGCCGCRLGEVGSNLFTRANLILCKRDYLRLFGTTGSCAACSKVIPAFEMVMRAKNNVYHLECFACQQCHQRFCVGDRFYLCDNQILCEYDYEERLIFANLAANPGHPAQFRGAPPPPPPPPAPPSSHQQPTHPGGDSGRASSVPEESSSSNRYAGLGPDGCWTSKQQNVVIAIKPDEVVPVHPHQQNGGTTEDASSSGYGSPDSGGLIDEG